jgi:hypothetical protein
MVNSVVTGAVNDGGYAREARVRFIGAGKKIPTGKGLGF